MKKYDYKKSTKDYKSILSPVSQKPQIFFGQDLFKDFEKNKLALSHKKSQDELLLTKQNIIQNKYHRRTNSNFGNYNENMTFIENNLGTNPSMYKFSFINKKNKYEKEKEKEKEKEIENNKKVLISRNKNVYQNLNQKKQCNNILSFSCSLKDFRKNIIDCYSSNNYLNKLKNNQNNNNFKYYNKEIKLKNNKALFFSENITNTNIEETRNTTSININNSNLMKSKFNEKEKEKLDDDKPIKCIKINRKHKRKLYSSMDNHLNINNNKNINFTESIKEKMSPKSNLHRFIYNKNNIKTNNNVNKTNNYNLNSSKKDFKKNENNLSKIQKDKKIFLINPISESYYDEPLGCCYKSEIELNKDIKINSSIISPEKNNIFNRNNFPSTTKNNNKFIITNTFNFSKNKYGMQRSQENFYKNKIQEIEPINEFDSVEEIHFMFVQMIQNKKRFFEKYDINKK